VRFTYFLHSRNLWIVSEFQDTTFLTDDVTSLLTFDTKYEKQLDQMLWKVAYEDITITKARVIGSISQVNLTEVNVH